MRFRRKSLFLVLLALVYVSQVQGRLVTTLTYEELFKRSDLVVIATPLEKTHDTSEQSFLPNIYQREPDGMSEEIPSVGVETRFRVALVLKGDKDLREFVLHHYREANSPEVELNGPELVTFDPSGVRSRNSYLMFLVREVDGRYAATGGQTDPGMQSISPVPLELTHAGLSY